MLSSDFRHRKLAARAHVRKQQTAYNESCYVRRSYETNMDGSRKWSVDSSSSETHDFDTFDEAMTHVRERRRTATVEGAY